MKHMLALMAFAVALILPAVHNAYAEDAAPAAAKMEAKAEKDKMAAKPLMHHHKHHHMMAAHKAMPVSTSDVEPGVYELTNGNKLIVQGKTAWLQPAGGSKFYAPDNGYVTRSGETIYTESGQVYRVAHRK